MNLPAPVGRQSDVLYLPTMGHAVVLGTAGSGKTIVAAHRALHLSDPLVEGHGRTLLVTFNKALVTYLEHLLAGRPNLLRVENYHTFARGYLADRGLMPHRNGIADNDLKRRLVSESITAVRSGYQPHAIFDREVDFFSDEISWIAQNGYRDDLEGYRRAQRIGRGKALQQGERRVVAQVSSEYVERLTARKPYDWDSLASATKQQLKIDNRNRYYDHIVIDEGQDFSPEMIRSLVLAAGSSVTFFGDYAQQIYGRGMSWQATGLQVQAVYNFEENYRNTREIAALAIAISETSAYRGTADLVTPRSPRSGGPLPTLVSCRDNRAEIRLAVVQARQLGEYGTVAVLFRDRADEGVFVGAFGRGGRRLHRDMNSWDPSPGVFHGVYHSAKGLEFDSVIMPYCGDRRLPDPHSVSVFGEGEAQARDARLLYVGVTRAKQNLIITHSGPLSSLFPSDDNLYAHEVA